MAMKDPTRAQMVLMCFALQVEAIGFSALTAFFAAFACNEGGGDVCVQFEGLKAMEEVIGKTFLIQLAIIVLAGYRAIRARSYGHIGVAAVLVHVVSLSMLRIHY